MATPRQRLPELSVMNILLCLFVIFIHTSGQAVVDYPAESWQHLAVRIPWQLAGMAVYGFIFLSGLKLCLPSGRQFRLGRFYLGRVRTILVPYLLWTVVYFISFAASGRLEPTPSRFLEALCTGNATGHLYFIIIILQFYLLAPLWRWCVQKIHPAIALPFATILNYLFWAKLPTLLPSLGIEGFIYNDRIFPTYLFFWLAGCYVGADYARFCEGLAARFKSVTVAFCVFAALDVAVAYVNALGVVRLPIQTETKMLFLIAAILFVFSLSQKIAAKGWYEKPGVALLDRSSFSIYLSHILVMELLVNKWIVGWGIQSPAPAFGLRTLLTVGITLPLCMGYTALKSRLFKKIG